VGAVLAFPIAWVVYTLLRGRVTTNPVTGADFWYPYPFLDPNNFETGYAVVAAYVVGISLAFAVVATAVVWVGRRRVPATTTVRPAQSVPL
jgi:hypothetical protein